MRLLAVSTLPLLLACSSGTAATTSGSPSLCRPHAVTAANPLGGSDLEEVSDFGDDAAGLRMLVHAPAGGSASAVDVALHGCTQRAADYQAAGWDAVADARGLAVVYAEQSTTNDASRCFRWWDPAHTSTGKGEARAIAAMAKHAMKTYGATRAFVTGLSAGGAMTAVMLAAYPDVFEAGAVMSGIPYGCAKSQLEAFGCMSGKPKDADAWAALVGEAARAHPPRVSIWQGDADWTVRPDNGVELVRQWTKVNGVAEEPSTTTAVGPAEHAVYADASGVVRVESWTLTGMGHGVAVDTKSGCGSAGAYALDVGVCSTSQVADFFLGTSGSPSGPSPSSPAAPADPCD